MSKKSRLAPVAEIALVFTISAALGIGWNRDLLTDAWRGTPSQEALFARQAPGEGAPAAAQGEVLPMPIGLAQVKEMHDAGEVVLIDARSADAFARERIAGALSLPLDKARQRAGGALLEQVPSDAVVVTYCNGFSCHDSMELGKLLIGSGYSSVYVFEGGLPEWRDAGYPVAGGAP